MAHLCRGPVIRPACEVVADVRGKKSNAARREESRRTRCESEPGQEAIQRHGSNHPLNPAGQDGRRRRVVVVVLNHAIAVDHEGAGLDRAVEPLDAPVEI